MKNKFAALIAATFVATPVMAQDFNNQVFANQHVKAIELSQTEMKETQGDAIWFVPAILNGVRIGLTGFTRHGLNQAISCGGVGVSNQVIMNTMRNPVKIVNQSGGRLDLLVLIEALLF